MAEPLRVVIAEDHYLVREGSRRLLEDSGHVDVVASVGTATELLDAVDRLRPTLFSLTSGCHPATAWKASRRRTQSGSASRQPASYSPSTPTAGTPSNC